MNEGWKVVTLKEITSILGDGLHGTPKYSDTGEYYFINGNNLVDGKITFFPSTKKVDKAEYLKYKKNLNGRTVMVSINGTIGNVAYYENEPVVLGKSACYFNINDGVDKKFIRYVLASRYFQLYIESQATGTTIKNVSLKTMRGFSFLLPPFEQQKDISNALSSLDDKIALLRQQNATLESMAQALFKSWFVDFDPVIDNALAAGRELPEALAGRVAKRQAVLASGEYPGLPEGVKGLFPDGFVFSEELGRWVPEGWGVGKIKDVATNLKRSIRPEEMIDGTPYIGLQDMPQKSIALGSWSVSDEVGSNKYQFKKGEILFGKLRPYFHKVGIASVDGICSTDILVLKPRKEEYLSLLLGHVNSVKLIDHVTACSTGTRMPRTNWSDIGGYEIVIPPLKSAKHLSNLLQEHLSQIDNNIHEITTLTRLRDVLLPELISGRLEV